MTRIAYTLDVVGNRLEKKVTPPSGPLATTTYTYNSNDELETESGPDGVITYGYNANGETTSKSSSAGLITYSWDFEGRLVGASSATELLAFAYDADGIRTAKSVNGTLTRFVVDKNRDYAQVLEERDITSAVQVAYIYGDDLVSQERAGGALSFYHYDGQLSTRQLTDGAAAVTDSYTFDAFGVILATSGSTPNNFLYTGEQHDPNLGFYYLRARYSNSAVGRFVSQDPRQGEQDPSTLHRYLYVGADPVNAFDPSGEFTLVNTLGAILVLTILLTMRSSAGPMPSHRIFISVFYQDPYALYTPRAFEHFIRIVNRCLAEEASRLTWNFIPGKEPTRLGAIAHGQFNAYFETTSGGVVPGASRTGEYFSRVFPDVVRSMLKSGGYMPRDIDNDVLYANILVHELIFHAIAGEYDYWPVVTKGSETGDPFDITNRTLPQEQVSAPGFIPPGACNEFKLLLGVK